MKQISERLIGNSTKTFQKNIISQYSSMFVEEMKPNLPYQDKKDKKGKGIVYDYLIKIIK